MITPGTRVWYWARRAGEKPHLKEGVVRDINYPAGLARVDLGDACAVPVQTVEIKRLKTERPPFKHDTSMARFVGGFFPS